MYRKPLIKIFLIGSLAATATCAVAQSESASLSVSGTLQPAACTLNLANGGAFDYGNVPSDRLDDRGFYNALDVKESGFTVSCTAPAQVALKSADNRAGTLPFISNVSIFDDIWSPQYLHGLGQSNGKKIGGYGLIIGTTVQADGADADVILREGGGPWERAKSGALTPNDRQLSWAASGQTTPLAIKTVTGTLKMQAVIDHVSNLDLSKDIKLDGLATLSLVYL